jgi:glycosyltransferase involved in cell wall biosynthesis
MSDPKVTVVIPAYLPNEDYFVFLEKAVESVFSQTYKNIELSIIFNGPYHKNITGANNIVLNYKTSAAVARNIGAAISNSSNYFAFLDADDYYDPLKIEKQINNSMTENIDFVFTEANVVDKEGKLCGEYPFTNNAYDTENLKTLLLQDNVLILSSSLIKAEAFFKCGMFSPTNEYRILGNPKHHNNNGNLCEDYFLWISALAKGFTFKKIPERLTYYRLNTSVAR